MNMLRVWGGGFYESDEFYDGCDELGLIVWQDFPYACSYYPDDEGACVAAAREARIAVRRLRNRACLAIWCGNNENQTMRDRGWDDATKHPTRYHGARIYDQVLPGVLASLDPGRPYIPSSPFGREQANSGRDGDQHYWDVWHGRGDWKHYADSDARFCSEFGFASSPGRLAWQTIDPNSNLLSRPVRDPIARWHDKTGKGYDTFLDLVELHYPRSETIEDWWYYSQLNQRDALRFGIEHYRRSEFCRGTLIWQLNDCWPAQSWAVIDSACCYKASAYDLRRLYAPLLCSLQRVDHQVHCWGILDNATSSQGATFNLEVRSLLHDQLLDRRESSVSLQPGERRHLATLDIGTYDPRTTIIVTEVDGRSSFLLLCEPKEVELRAATITVHPVTDGLLLESDGPVVDLWLGSEHGSCEFADNFITMAQAGSRLIRCTNVPDALVARSLAGLHEIRFA